jgi:hypothetical protein
VAPSKLRTLIVMNPRRRAFMVEAAFWLVVARLVSGFMPFQQIARRLGDLTPPHEALERLAQTRTSGRDVETARMIGWAVTRMSGYVPFKAVCLQQAIAAKAMLRRRGITSALHFGVSQPGADARSFEAHAWLDAPGALVTGYPIKSGFTEIACFV